MKKSKLKVEVFFPFGACACAYAPLIDKVGRVTAKFKGNIDVQMRSTKSKEAREYGIQESCVIIDSVIKLTADFDQKELEETITKRTVAFSQRG